MFHYFLQLNFATILISFFLLIFVNVNPAFQRKVIRLFSIAISSVLCLVILTNKLYKTEPTYESLIAVFIAVTNTIAAILDADHLMESKCLTAVISIDLNNLKRLNDENGHAAGDTALCTIVACIQNILPRGCHLYRTDGDEFMILCSRVSKDDVPALIDHMRRELSKTPYCCAIGFATPDADEDFEHICSIADAAMYANKKQLKGEETIR